MEAIKNLSISLSYGRGQGKVKVITIVSIRLGNTLVGSGVLGGKYSEEQVRAELKRCPTRFTQSDGWQTAQAMGLVA